MQFVWKHRDPLTCTLRALERGTLTLGFIGGSITDGRGMHNWPEAVCAWFVERYPDVQIAVENAGIGATNSDLAVFRAKRDLIDRGCDLVFVEFAVNDNGMEPTRRARAREGLIRRLLADGGRDVVVVYTYMQEMYDDIMNGRVPKSVADFEALCEHYRLGSVWMSRYAIDEIQKGRMRWEEWLPDGLHPKERGSLSYAQSVIAYLEKELSGAVAGEKSALPSPMDEKNWERIAFVPFNQVEKKGPWLIRRSLENVWIDSMLTTSAPDASLRFTFDGRGVALGLNYGKLSSEFRYRIDGGEWMMTRGDRSDWVPDSNWLLLRALADDLESGRHTVELISVHGNAPACNGTRCAIAFIGIIE